VSNPRGVMQTCTKYVAVQVHVAVQVAVHVTHTDSTVLQQHSRVSQICLCKSFTLIPLCCNNALVSNPRGVMQTCTTHVAAHVHVAVHVTRIDSSVLQQQFSVATPWCHADMHNACCSASVGCSACLCISLTFTWVFLSSLYLQIYV